MEIKKHYASFSEAIREGARLHLQGVEYYFSSNKSCAVGAGLEAMFGLESRYGGEPDLYADESDIIPLYPCLTETSVKCPACEGVNGMPISVIYHLNDDHRWTRERIADWLEKEEEKLGYVTLIETEPINISERGITEGASVSAL